MKKLRVLAIAYPFAPVAPDTAGGAEQILLRIDNALVRNGHRSIIIARENSQTSGLLMPVPKMKGLIDEARRREAHEAVRRTTREALRDFDIDIVHMHGVDFYEYLPPEGLPVLVTLHLPISFYPAWALQPANPDIHFNCVSYSQQAGCPPQMRPPVIQNGIQVESFRMDIRKRDFVLSMGRICPEKGFHIALDAARRAKVLLLLAGEVFPYGEHIRYFEEEIIPRLGEWGIFLGRVGFERKRRLLSAARAVLVPSLVPETSSLVAMEALACGTPVIAFANGALPEIVEDGKTGFLVRDEADMASAIRRSGAIDPDMCRKEAALRFREEKMLRQYFELYERILHAPEPAC